MSSATKMHNITRNVAVKTTLTHCDPNQLQFNFKHQNPKFSYFQTDCLDMPTAMDDLEDAVQDAQAALDKTPNGHPGHATCLFELGERFDDLFLESKEKK
jgi:hypothetical protein